MIGQTISHYEILEKLGEGGMGVVYKAQDTKLDRPVALKFLPPSLVTSEEEVLRFQQEAKAISSLNHTHIATIHDFDVAEGKRFLVLEYLPKGTLKSRIKDLNLSGRELPLAQTVEYAIQIADGLSYAHQHGIIHRDVKTDNMILAEEGKVKITDFGLAKVRGSAHLTKSGMTVGTAAYMSPEQIRGENVDHQSDLFSFGVVLYELTTGHLPFRGEHEAAVSYSIVNEDHILVKSIRPGIPSSLEQVISRCLEKNTEKRYQSAKEIAVDLREVQKEIAESVTAKSKPSRIRLIATTAIVILALIALYIFYPSRPASVEGKSIAVLPFVDISPERDQEYFCDGMTEELINALARLEGLRVAARSSAFQFKGVSEDVRTVGEKLNVTTVLEGSVRKAGSTLRITAQLINASDGYQLWSKTYERELKDVFAIQENISRSIADALRIELVGQESIPIVKRYTENLEAYNLYLQGRYYWNKRTEEGLKKAIDYFGQAIGMDPSYALAYAGQADSYNLLPHYGFFAPKETMPRAKAAALKALQIDSTLAEGHTSLAFVRLIHDWDWKEAEKEFKRAIELNSSYATAYHWYAFSFIALGRSDEAINTMKRAQELEPLSLPINRDLGQTYYLGGQYDQAIEQLRKTLDMDSTFAIARSDLGLAYIQKGMYEEAILQIEKAAAPSGRTPRILGALGYAHAAAGKTEKALEVIDELKQLSTQKYVSPFWLAMIYSGLGDRKFAFASLEKAYEEHFSLGFYLRLAPQFDSVRSDPRFIALVKKVGFEE